MLWLCHCLSSYSTVRECIRGVALPMHRGLPFCEKNQLLVDSSLGLCQLFSGAIEDFGENISKQTCLWLIIEFHIASFSIRQADVKWNSDKHGQQNSTFSLEDAIAAKYGEAVPEAQLSPLLFNWMVTTDAELGVSFMPLMACVDVQSSLMNISTGSWLHLLSRSLQCLAPLNIPPPDLKSAGRLGREVQWCSSSWTVANFLDLQEEHIIWPIESWSRSMKLPLSAYTSYTWKGCTPLVWKGCVLLYLHCV